MSSQFATLLRSAADGEVVAPLLRAYLTDVHWEEDFAVHFRKGSDVRKPDGWFHPSAHPTWPERMLWWYITQPEALIPERMALENTISVTLGSAVHGFIETCLKHMGLLLTTDQLRDLGYTVNGGEPQAIDPEVRTKGHMDGILDVHLPDFPEPRYHHFEFKSANKEAIMSIDTMDTPAFIKKWPGYYAQVQEYLRMTGFSVSVVVMMQMGFPWTLREFHIPANRQYQVDVAGKYHRVLRAAESGVMPAPCCSVGSAESKRCPARGICPQAGGGQ